MNRVEGYRRIPTDQLLSFEGKTVLVTGAASGIGRAISSRFAEAGANLILLDNNQKGLVDTVTGFENKTGTYTTHRVDLSDKNEIDEFWKNIQVSPDILVNNVGIYPEQNFLNLSKEDLQKTFDINANSAVWMCQNFIKTREKQGGVIVNISSIEAMISIKKDLVPYGMSKAGILALTGGLANEYGRKGFRVNVVLPGAIKTPGTELLIRKGITHFRFDLVKTGINFNRRLSLGRWGNPDEVAKPVLFLASDMSSYLNGTQIRVDGGFLSS